MVIHIEKDRLGAIQAAIQALDLGNVIAVPTETVYGLAADATNDAAVRQIFAIKQRPSFNPLICHCSDLAMLSRYAVLDPMSEKLARSFWPGPMTIVLPMRAGGGSRRSPQLVFRRSPYEYLQASPMSSLPRSDVRLLHRVRISRGGSRQPRRAMWSANLVQLCLLSSTTVRPKSA